MMNPQRTLTHLHHRKLKTLVLLLSGFALCAVGMVSSTVQSNAQGNVVEKEEREIEDKIPKHLPIKIKIKNAEKSKDLKNDRWLADLEIEVKNTGDKPIYYLRISLFFIDVHKNSGEDIGYPLRYGRPELIDISEQATPDDVPIKPGETYTFKMPETYIKGWRWYKTKVEEKPHPKKVGLLFHVLSFGDGTGFVTTGGLPVPNLPNRQSPIEGKERKPTLYRWLATPTQCCLRNHHKGFA